MWEKIIDRFFCRLLWSIAIVLICLYLAYATEPTIFELPRFPFLFGTIVIGLLFIIRYRRNDLFCYETIFFILYIVSVFFKDLILDNIIDDSMVSSVFYTSFSPRTENAGIILQSLAFVAFLLGAARIKHQTFSNSQTKRFKITKDFSRIGSLLGLIECLFILYLFLTGSIFSWFQYSSGGNNNFSNFYIIILTSLFLLHTPIEFVRLYSKGCNSFSMFLRYVNRVYFLSILLISVFLLISGNRNESLLVFLPMIISYSIFIKHLSNRVFFMLLVAGTGVMIFIGVTRQLGMGEINSEPITLFETARDFGFVDNNTKYLFEIVEKDGPIYFKNAFLNVVSAVPFFGGFIVYLTGLQYHIRSGELTTNGMQLAGNMDSGLGTSLIGDLYYTGGFLFMVVFMYCLGWYLSKQYRRFMVTYDFSFWSLIVYLFMFSNVVYYIRAEWTMPIRYIGFSFVIYLVLNGLGKSKTLK